MKPQTRVFVSRENQLLERIGNTKSFKMLLKALEDEPEGSLNRVEVSFSYEPLPDKDVILHDVPTDTSTKSMTREIKSGGFVKDGVREKVEENLENKELIRDKLRKETYMED